MTTKALKKKVIDYINHAEEDVLKTVYNMLKLYEDGESKSLMDLEQKAEIERRSALFKQGKLKSASWADVKKRGRSA